MMRPRFLILIMVSMWAWYGFAGHFQVNREQSEVKATAKATGHHFDAIPEKYECDIEISKDDLTLLGGNFSFDLADLKTGKNKRDTEMLHWLENQLFPTLNFKITGLEKKGEQQLMVGDLTLHNQTQRLEIPITLTQDEEGIRLSGDVAFSTTDFGLKKIRKMLMLTVDPLVQVHFDLKGTLE